MISSHARIPILFSLFFLNLSSFAAAEIFPLPARLLGDGAAGTTAGTRGDLMLPLFGNERGIVYGDVQGKYYRDDSWFGGIAGGLRQTFGPYILGGYLFADRSESSSNKHFWSLNPGLEGINAQWDAHLNGYFPVGSRSKTFRSAWADELGDYRFVSFSGHKQFDHILVDTETAGRGVDAEVGYRVLPFNNVRLALGGYYFNFQNMNDMRGVIGTIEYPFNDRVTVLAQDAYDNLHNNTFMLTVRLRFGAINPQEGRMLEPIRRNLGTLDSGTSIPTERAWLDSGANLVEKDHIWFFKPGGKIFDPAKGLANCTAEDPCANTELTQFKVDTINSLDANSTLALATGIYLLDPTGDGLLELNQGQSIEGKTFDFVKPAFGEGRPNLIGALVLPGFNSVSNIFLDNQIEALALSSQQRSLLTAQQTIQSTAEIVRGDATIRNVTIGLNSSYELGIDIVSSNGSRPTVNLITSRLFMESHNSRRVTGIRTNNATLRSIGNTISVVARTVGTAHLPVVARGIELNGQSALEMVNNTVETIAELRNTATAPLMSAEGIVVNGASTFKISRLSEIIARARAGNSSPLAQAISITNNSSVINTGSISDSYLRAQAVTQVGIAGAWGIRQPSDRRIKRTNVNIFRTAEGPITIGQDIGP